MKAWQNTALGILLGLLAAGLVLLFSGKPGGEAAMLVKPPTPSPLMVQVEGSVAQPGLYALPEGSRVADAVRAAGGLTADAEREAINQAARLRDGDTVRVPARVEGGQAPDTGGAQRSSPLPASQLGAKVDINTATAEELQTLPGIGPTRADAIIQYRQDHGPFKTIDDLVDVPGIGPTTFENLKDLVTAG